jgi:membrane protein implicated in regulation of membrane protease activity
MQTVTDPSQRGYDPGTIKEANMIVLGVILALIGALAGISILLWLGVILLVVGLVMNFAPGPWVGTGGARRRYW